MSMTMDHLLNGIARRYRVEQEWRELHREIGAAMRSRREVCGKSLRLVAKEIGKSSAYISDLELGRRNWTPEILNLYLAYTIRHD